MSASTARHETRALLRAHLAAASGYRHFTRNCPVCYRLLRLAMEPVTAPQPPRAARGPGGDSTEARTGREGPTGAVEDGSAAPSTPEPPATRPDGTNDGNTARNTSGNTAGNTGGEDRDDGIGDKRGNQDGDERPPPT